VIPKNTKGVARLRVCLYHNHDAVAVAAGRRDRR
jgi:hypothetical protein